MRNKCAADRPSLAAALIGRGDGITKVFSAIASNLARTSCCPSLGKSLGKLGAHHALFSPLARRSSLRPKQWKIVGQILVLGQSVVASMRRALSGVLRR
jgi:hypothetical protein